jgi:putative CocE/NonD family hydrolase
VLTLPLCGPQDQRPVQAPHAGDMASFATAALDEPLLVHGEVSARLFVSTSARDIEVMVKLMDVYPSGETMLLLDGALRMRGRGGMYAPAFAPPLVAGAIYNVTVSLGWFSYAVTPGHSLRLDVAGSNWPRFSINMNTGAPISDNSSVPVVARTQVHHDAAHPSALLLPLLRTGLASLPAI